MEQPSMTEILESCCDEGGSYIAFDKRNLSALVNKDWHIPDHDPSSILAKFDDPSARKCKSGRKVTAVIVADVFIKRYNFHGYWQSFRKLFKLSRAERVLAGALRLKEFAIPTPEVLAAVRVKRFLLPQHDYMIARLLSPTQLQLDDLAGEFAQGDPYRQFVSGMTSLLVKMHAAGVEHGDLSLRNIFCRKNQVGVYSDWGVFDLDGCQIHVDEMPVRNRRRELARLISSFLRCAKAKAPQVKIDTDLVIEDFTRKYKELSGYNLAGSGLDERVGYLTGRIRRDHTKQ